MADIGWVTGHSYIVYGPLANATTGIIYEGAIDHPDKDRWAQIAAKYRATILYTAPTAIRALMKYGAEIFTRDDLSSLRLLGSVGEPINPEAWAWYWKYIGGERCPVVDTWWQTETGMIMITPLPGITTLSLARRRNRFQESQPRSATSAATRSRSAVVSSRSRGRGHRCCAASTGIRTATS